MRRTRATIAALLAYVALVSVGLAALRVSSRLWASVGFSLALMLLVAAVAGSIYRRGAGRAFWLGFALFGWTYLLMAFAPAPLNAWRDLLITSPALMILEDSLREAPPPANTTRLLGPAAARPKSAAFVELTPWSYLTAPDRSNPFASDSFSRIGHSFSCIAIAIGGGVFCRYLHETRDPSSPSP